MKCLIAYFSATGNTKRCVDEYVSHFKENNIDYYLHNIEDDFNFNYDFDTLIIAYPIHGFNCPINMINFVKKLKKEKIKKRLIILKTSGEPLRINNISSYSLRRILKRKNYYLTNEYHYVMPYDIIFRHTKLMAYNMNETMIKLINLDFKDIINNKKVLLKYMPFGHIIQLIMLIEHPGARINGFFMKANNKCVLCQKCIKECPTNNISIKNGKLKFHFNCLMCTRCAFNCPKDAIKFGLFNKWKVNGKYDFKKPEEIEIDKHNRYCKKAYIKYFKNAEKRINNDITK